MQTAPPTVERIPFRGPRSAASHGLDDRFGAGARPRGRRAAFLHIAAAFAVLIALAGCASSPSLKRAVEIQDSDPVEVIYEQAQSGLRQTLLTESVVPANELYSSREGDSLAKVLSTGQMQVLLDALATYGFFEHARPGTGEGSPFRLAVRIGGREQAWVKHGGMGIDELTRYHEAMAAFLNIYNATDSFHTGRSGAGTSAASDGILDEPDRLRARNLEALRSRTGNHP